MTDKRHKTTGTVANTYIPKAIVAVIAQMSNMALAKAAKKTYGFNKQTNTHNNFSNSNINQHPMRYLPA